MQTFLSLILIFFVIMAAVSLVRGVIAFLQTTKIDLETGEGHNATEMQLKQNRMMFARIKYQALAVLVVGILLALSR